MAVTSRRFASVLSLGWRSWLMGLAALASVVVIVTALMLRQASRAVRESAARVQAESELAFTVNRLDVNVSTAARSALGNVESSGGSPSSQIASSGGFETISSPAVFNDAQMFQGQLFVSGPSGLLVYDATGQVTERYRVGLELPAAPLVSMTTGVAVGAAQPELLVATAGEGLLAFDGHSFHQLLPAEPPYRRLTAVKGLESGRILLGTEKKGVLAFDGQRLAPLNPELADIHVTALAGNESNLWIGTLDRGVWRWHAGQLDRFSEQDGMPDPHVLSIAVDGDSAYVGTPLGVTEFRDGRFARVLAHDRIARSLLVRHEPRGATLVVGTVDQGLVRVPLKANMPSPSAFGGESGADFRVGTPDQTGSALRSSAVDSASGHAPQDGTVERLFETGGKLYALAENGVYAVDDHDGAWQQMARSQTYGALLTDRNVSALAVDRTGRLWVGYFDRGLDIVDGAAGTGTRHVRHVESDHVFCVNRIVPDPDRGVTAVATANGLVIFDVAGSVRQVMGRAEGLIADHVTDVLVGPTGMVVATPAGLTFVDSSGARSLYAFQGLVNNHVYTLAGSEKHLLAGTLGGLSVLDPPGGLGAAAMQGPGRLDDLVVRANYTTANSGLRHNWITAIVRVGEDWFVGTYGAGILRFDGADYWRTFPDASDRFVVNANAMLVTPSHVYAGTLDRGLYVYDRASQRWSALTKGLPSLNVQALAAGGGYLYVGTENGLVRMAEQD